ncbi:MAG: pesticin C-terminus-like muramidase [Dongiaceae bacterium]
MMFSNKPPGGPLDPKKILDPLHPFSLFGRPATPPINPIAKPKPPLADLVEGLAGIFGPPATDNYDEPFAQPKDWSKIWNIQPSNLPGLPVYPKPDDVTTGADIARNWHQLKKTFAQQTINENFPSYSALKPQPLTANQSYHDYMNEHQLVLNQMDPLQVASYVRTNKEPQQPNNGELKIDPNVRKRIQEEFKLNEAQKAAQDYISSKEGARAYPYHPGGTKSGATIGEGYDLGRRNSQEIQRDLRKAKVDELIIQKLTGAANQTGIPAQELADTLRKEGVSLTPEQIARLTVIAGKDLTRPLDDFADKHNLTPEEYQGMAGLVYMSGKNWFNNSKTKSHLEKGNYQQAVKDLEQAASEARMAAREKNDPVKEGHARRYQEMADIFKRRLPKNE